MNNTVNYDYAGARILVTGGTSGIGYAIARAFDRAGAQVTVPGTRDSPDSYDDVDLSRFSYCSLEVRDLDATRSIDSGKSSFCLAHVSCLPRPS